MTIDDLTDEDVALIILPIVIQTLGQEMGPVRLARVLMAAGLKLATDLDGEAAAWANLRDLLATATERARRAAHPAPRPAA